MQTHVKPFGLVLYSTDQREGATEEANAIGDSLTHVGITTSLFEWTDAKMLPPIIDSELSKLLSEGLSLLVVSLMSHGEAGNLAGANDSKMPISNILDLLKARLPAHIPLVS